MEDPPAPGGKIAGQEAPDAHYRVAFDHSFEAIAIVQDGVLKVANPATAKLSGYPLDELVGMPFLRLIAPEDHEQTVERYDRRIAGDTANRSMKVTGLDRRGRRIPLEANSMPVAWQGRPAVLVFLADVTDREIALAEAARQERMVSRIAEVAPYFIFIYDYELGRDVYLNRSVPEALGYSPEEAAALGDYPFLHLCHPDDLAQSLERDRRWREVPDGRVDAIEFRLRHRSGEWRWFVSHNTPFHRDEKGQVRQILGMSLDITEKKRSEELLRRTERLESLGLLAGGIAHDFSNLLTPILGNTELLLRHLPEEGAATERARAIASAAEGAAELVRQLLVYAGRGEIERRAVDLNGVIEDVVRLLDSMPSAGHVTRLDLQPDLPSVLGDASQLRQVVMNLISNAHDAVGARRGEVRVATRRIAVDERQLAACVLREGARPGAAVLLEISDDGVGMDGDTLARLWEPFFTTKKQGRGLGLPAVLGILRQHRAALAVDSEPGVGTRFRVLLPPARTEVPALR
ncbi:MAG: PAS domain S-box protein [Acidobacteria bacterium]|nr:PAS domain S-box protein [Acidobacteriota bacterium]MCB9378721.1 PAS domain S-box protein [Holophagales bacterium]